MATSLVRAVAHGQPKLVKKLLDQGAEVNQKDEYGETALSHAITSGNVEIIKMLLDKGAEVDEKDEYGETALRRATRGKNVEVVKILLDKGADPNLECSDGETPLSCAILDRSIDILRILLARGGDLNKPSTLGTPLEIAKKHGNKAVLNHLEIFERLHDSRQSAENYVLIRYWPPRIGRLTNVPYWVAALAGNVGHISISIKNGNTEELYMSHWPSEASKKPVESINKKLKKDFESEKTGPSKCIALYGLDVKKIIDKYKDIIKKPWSLKGDKNHNQKPKSYNCASAVYELLEAGGLFDYYLSEKDKLKGQIKPSQVMDLCVKAQSKENEFYADNSERLARTIEHEFIEAADRGTKHLNKFETKRKIDYVYLYKQLVPECNDFFENIKEKAEEADIARKEEFVEMAKSKAQKGSYKWNKYLSKDHKFEKKLTYFKDNCSEKQWHEFLQNLTLLRFMADEIKLKQLFKLIDDLKDLDGIADKQKKIRAQDHNSTVHQSFDKLMKKIPKLNLLLVDKSGLNILHKAILKGDIYCVQKIINYFPEIYNERVVPSIDYLPANAIKKMTLFAGVDLKYLLNKTPLELAIYRNDPNLIELFKPMQNSITLK